MTADLSAKRAYRGEIGRVNREPANGIYPVAAPIVRGLVRAVSKPVWAGPNDRLPSGPLIVTPNHLSQFDPLLLGMLLAYHGRWPHYLARANLFGRPILGTLLRRTDQIPVERGSVRAVSSLTAASKLLERGEIVIIYPEGGITRDPDEWPMAGHTGAVRLALRCGVPILPVAQWGTNYVLPSMHRHRPQLVPRVTCTVRCGELLTPAQLGRDDDHAGVRAATMMMMDAITTQLESIRGETAPALRWSCKARARIPRDQAIA